MLQNDAKMATLQSVRADVHVTLLTVLRCSRSKWAVPATDYYVAHLLTGIRPDDWSSVRRWSLGDGENEMPGLWVLVPNSLRTIYPFTRKTIMLNMYDAQLVECIDRHIMRIQACTTEAEARLFHTSCKRIVREIALRTFPDAIKFPLLSGGKSPLTQQQIAAIANAIHR